MIALPLVYCAPVANTAREETPKFGGAKSDTERFGPLKVILGGIPVLYANHEVRLNPHSTSSFTNEFPGNRRCEQQDRKPPLSCSHIGRTFKFTPKRCGRSEAP